MIDLQLDSRVLFLGDIHGKSDILSDAMEKANEHSIRHIIQLGDMDLYTMPDDNNSRRFIRSGGEVFFLPGNHENWNYLDSVSMRFASRIDFGMTYLPIGTRLNIGDKKVCAIGGAASINREYRNQNIKWFPQEVISEDQKKLIIRDGEADIILSHDAPYTAPIPYEATMGGYEMSQDLSDYLDSNRHTLDDITKELKPKMIFHGHYHYSYHSLVEYDDFTTSVTGLDKEYRSNSMALLDSDRMTVAMISF